MAPSSTKDTDYSKAFELCSTMRNSDPLDPVCIIEGRAPIVSETRIGLVKEDVALVLSQDGLEQLGEIEGKFQQCAPLLKHENIVVLVSKEGKFSVRELDT